MFDVAMVDLDLLTMCTVRITKKLNTYSGKYIEVLLMRTYLNKILNLKNRRGGKQSFLEICKFQKRALEVATFNSVVYRDREQVTHQGKPFVRNLYTLSKSGEFDSD